MLSSAAAPKSLREASLARVEEMLRDVSGALGTLTCRATQELLLIQASGRCAAAPPPRGALDFSAAHLAQRTLGTPWWEGGVPETEAFAPQTPWSSGSLEPVRASRTARVIARGLGFLRSGQGPR